MKKLIKWMSSILLILITLLAAGFVYESIAAQANEGEYPAPGEQVMIVENKLHINVMGEKSEYPPVVIETGSGSFSYDWLEVQEKLAEETLVVTYDRAGYGWSEEARTDRSPENIVKELNELLVSKGIDDPAILVGHSLGGLYTRYYAEKYPEQVAGLVLVDHRPVGMHDFLNELNPTAAKKMTEASAQQNFANKQLKRFGVLRLFKNQLAPDEFTEEQMETYLNVSLKAKQLNAMDEEIKYVDQLDQNLSNQSFDVPVTVLTHSDGLPFDAYGFSDEEVIQIEDFWLEQHKATAAASIEGTQMTVESGHNMMLEKPEVITKAVFDMVKE